MADLQIWLNPICEVVSLLVAVSLNVGGCDVVSLLVALSLNFGGTMHAVVWMPLGAPSSCVMPQVSVVPMVTLLLCQVVSMLVVLAARGVVVWRRLSSCQGNMVASLPHALSISAVGALSTEAVCRLEMKLAAVIAQLEIEFHVVSLPSVSADNSNPEAVNCMEMPPAAQAKHKIEIACRVAITLKSEVWSSLDKLADVVAIEGLACKSLLRWRCEKHQ